MESAKQQLYRMRFLEYLPSATECMSLTHDEKLLAIGRENGQIEIFKTDTWTMVHVIPGIKSSDIRNIMWFEPDFCSFSKPTNNLYTYNSTAGTVLPRRLITTGLNGAVIEWDLLNLQPRKIIDLGDVGVWNSCLSIPSAKSDQVETSSHNLMYLACDDGAIRVISLDSFSELKRFPSVNVRCLSIC